MRLSKGLAAEFPMLLLKSNSVMHAGLVLAVAVVPCHLWPLAPSEHIPSSAVPLSDRSPSPQRPHISPLLIPATQTHALFPAMLAATISKSPHACAQFDWTSCCLEVSVLSASPEATSSVTSEHAGSGVDDSDDAWDEPPVATPIARFSPIPCFPLKDPVATAVAASVTRSDGASARVRFTAVARIGSHACAEILVHAGVSLHNSYSRTLFVRPAPPTDSGAAHVVNPPPRMRVAVPEGSTAYLPAACIVHGGIQVCMETSSSVVHRVPGAISGGSGMLVGPSHDSNAWSKTIAIARRRTALDADSAQARRQPPERTQLVRSAQHALSVRQFATLATVAGAPPEVHVSLCGACTLINALPVGAAVLLEESKREGTVHVEPFSICDVPVAGCLTQALVRVTLDHTEQSELATLTPGKHTLIHCRHHACWSCTAVSTIIGSLSRSNDCACIVLYAHACVQNASPLPLHIAIANAPLAQAEPQAGGRSDAPRHTGVRPSVAAAALATILQRDNVTVRLPYMHAFGDSKKSLPAHWDPSQHLSGHLRGGSHGDSAQAIPRSRRQGSDRNVGDNPSPRGGSARGGHGRAHPGVTTMGLFDTHAANASQPGTSSALNTPRDRSSGVPDSHAWSPPTRTRSPALLPSPNAAASPLPPSPHLEHLWPLNTTARMQESDADVSMHQEDSVGLADVLTGTSATSSSMFPQRAISGTLPNSNTRHGHPQGGSQGHSIRPGSRQYSADSPAAGNSSQHAKQASSGGHGSSSSTNINTPLVKSAMHAPILLSLPPSASLSTSDTLLHVARLDDTNVVASDAADGSMLTLHALRSNSVPLHSKARGALGRTFLSDDSAPGDPSSHTLRVPLQPPAAHAALLQMSLQALPPFNPFILENSPIRGVHSQHPAADVLATVPALKFAFVAPTHVVVNRMHEHITLERPLPSGLGNSLTHQHAPADSETLLMCPQDTPPVATPAISLPPPSVRLTLASEGTNHTGHVTLTQLPPVAIQLTKVSAAPVATTVQTHSVQLTAPLLMMPDLVQHRRGHCWRSYPLEPPSVLVTTFDTFQDTHATAHIMNLTPHNLRAYPHPPNSSRASSLSPAAAETPHNIFQEVPPFSRRPFLWDSASAAALAEAIGALCTETPPLPPVKMHSDIGITFEVNVGKIEGWPVRVADLLLPTGAKPARGSAAALSQRFGIVRISADGAMAADARAVAEGLQLDVKRPRPWCIEIVVSSLQAHGAAATHGVKLSPQRATPEATAHAVRTADQKLPEDASEVVSRANSMRHSTQRCASVLRARLDLAGGLLSVLHRERCREVMVGRVCGVRACVKVDDEGLVDVSGEVKSLRATSSDPHALFPVVLASPVQPARTTQVGFPSIFLCVM